LLNGRQVEPWVVRDQDRLLTTNLSRQRRRTVLVALSADEKAIALQGEIYGTC
jgi:hypothetical protein